MTATIHSLAERRSNQSRAFDPIDLRDILADFLGRSKPKRGEAKARWLLRHLDNAQVPFEVAKATNGDWGIRFPTFASLTEAQREVVRDAAYFVCGYPGCFKVMVNMLRRERPSVVTGVNS